MDAEARMEMIRAVRDEEGMCLGQEDREIELVLRCYECGGKCFGFEICQRCYRPICPRCFGVGDGEVDRHVRGECWNYLPEKEWKVKSAH